MRGWTLWLGAIAVSALAIGCGNNGNSSTQGATGTSGSSDTNAATRTLTGCVQQGEPAGTYVLVTHGDESGTSADEKRGTSGSMSGSSSSAGEERERGEESGETYRLIATGNLDLARSLGKQVTVTGDVTQLSGNNGASGSGGSMGTSGSESSKNPSSGSSSSGSAEGSGSVGSGSAGSSPNANAQFLRVRSLTKVSDSCAASGTEGGK